MAPEAADLGDMYRLWFEALVAIQEGDHPTIDNHLQILLDWAEAGKISPTHLAFLYAEKEDDAHAALWLQKAYQSQDAILVSPLYFFLPEDWPDLPGVRAALDQPGLRELQALRRQFIAAGSGRVLPPSNEVIIL